MMGMQIEKQEPHRQGVQLCGILALVSLILIVWKGPRWVPWVSWVGLLSGLGTLLWLIFRKKTSEGRVVLVILSLFHGILLGVAAGLDSLFLSPLPDQQLQLPRLSRPYDDPDGRYRLTGPINWDYFQLHGAQEYGVRIRPRSKAQYMGASEIQVWIRPLGKKPTLGNKFITTMAQMLATSKRDPRQKTMFRLETEPATLLNEETGVFTILDVKRLWVPIRQITLFGMKEERFLCSVSVTGFQAHAVLSKVMCLGIFETIRISI